MTRSEHKSWYSNQIAKLFLTGTDTLDILEEGKSKSEDFIIRSRKNGQVYSVDVKPSKYSFSEIKKGYKDLRLKREKDGRPFVMMYINYQEKTGFFEIIANGHSVELSELRVGELKNAIN